MKKIVIVGLGLIGGSLALGLKGFEEYRGGTQFSLKCCALGV